MPKRRAAPDPTFADILLRSPRAAALILGHLNAADCARASELCAAARAISRPLLAARGVTAADVAAGIHSRVLYRIIARANAASAAAGGGGCVDGGAMAGLGGRGDSGSAGPVTAVGGGGEGLAVGGLAGRDGAAGAVNIRLPPGLYDLAQRPLVVTAPRVAIVGASEGVLIDMGGGAIEVHAEEFSLADVQVRGAAECGGSGALGASRSSRAAIAVVSGSARVANCNVSGGVAVSQAGRLELLGCAVYASRRFRKSADCPLNSEESASEFWPQSGSGVLVRGRASIVNCTLEDNEEAGVDVAESGKVHLQVGQQQVKLGGKLMTPDGFTTLNWVGGQQETRTVDVHAAGSSW